ncbi:MAG: zinc ABC transporter substrate-binding protein, partial [Schwartzia sp.]|nr:zinc ABC transporter substrate-binding protein [Schwartzia sp. (in: firmicutes)]
MKKLLSILVCLMLVAVLGGCGNQAAQKPEEKSAPKKLKIVTTIFPLQDWTREILGKEAANADLTMLIKSGVDMHSYQPTADDLVKISSCDVLIYVGGESDQWIEKARKEAVNKNMVTVRLMDALGDRLKHEETVEGMEAHHHHHDEKDEHKHDEKDEHHEEKHKHEEEKHEHHEEYDEHIWLSLKNAQLCAD